MVGQLLARDNYSQNASLTNSLNISKNILLTHTSRIKKLHTEKTISAWSFSILISFTKDDYFFVASKISLNFKIISTQPSIPSLPESNVI